MYIIYVRCMFYIIKVNSKEGKFFVTKYVVKRLLQLIPIILGITFLSYAMMQVAGSDFIEQAANNTGTVMSAEAMQKAREALGLDKPFIIQYFNWLG